jgi:hypothetical protein
MFGVVGSPTDLDLLTDDREQIGLGSGQVLAEYEWQAEDA